MKSEEENWKNVEENPAILRRKVREQAEEIKLMEEVITYSNAVRNDILSEEDGVIMSAQCKEWVDGLLERLTALQEFRKRNPSLLEPEKGNNNG